MNFKTQKHVEETKKFTSPYGADFAIFAFGGETTIVDPLSTHFMPLEEISKAVDLLIDRPDRALGIVLKMSH